MAEYNQKLFDIAHRKFLEHEALTDDDIAQFEILSRNLAERARARRAGFVPSETADERTLLNKAATKRDVQSIVADVVMPYLLTYRHRIDVLEAHLKELAAKPHVKYTGVYQTGKTYGPGDAATHAGSLWICKTDDAGEPGKDFVGWQLAVKRGRDGRDAR
jgi:hypothetical protein